MNKRVCKKVLLATALLGVLGQGYAQALSRPTSVLNTFGVSAIVSAFIVAGKIGVDAKNLQTKTVTRTSRLVKPSLKQRASAFGAAYRAAARNIFAEIKDVFAPMSSKSPGEKIPNFGRRALKLGKNHPSLAAAAAVAVVPMAVVALANRFASVKTPASSVSTSATSSAPVSSTVPVASTTSTGSPAAGSSTASGTPSVDSLVTLVTASKLVVPVVASSSVASTTTTATTATAATAMLSTAPSTVSTPEASSTASAHSVASASTTTIAASSAAPKPVVSAAAAAPSVDSVATAAGENDIKVLTAYGYLAHSPTGLYRVGESVYYVTTIKDRGDSRSHVKCVRGVDTSVQQPAPGRTAAPSAVSASTTTVVTTASAVSVGGDDDLNLNAPVSAPLAVHGSSSSAAAAAPLALPPSVKVANKMVIIPDQIPTVASLKGLRVEGFYAHPKAGVYYVHSVTNKRMGTFWTSTKINADLSAQIVAGLQQPVAAPAPVSAGVSASAVVSGGDDDLDLNDRQYDFLNDDVDVSPAIGALLAQFDSTSNAASGLGDTSTSTPCVDWVASQASDARRLRLVPQQIRSARALSASTLRQPQRDASSTPVASPAPSVPVQGQSAPETVSASALDVSPTRAERVATISSGSPTNSPVLGGASDTVSPLQSPNPSRQGTRLVAVDVDSVSLGEGDSRVEQPLSTGKMRVRYFSDEKMFLVPFATYASEQALPDIPGYYKVGEKVFYRIQDSVGKWVNTDRTYDCNLS